MDANFTRRHALRLLGGVGAVAASRRLFAMAGQQGAPDSITVTPGPFTNTRESLAKYTIPEWFHDAKFGLWSHWGPQSAVEDGDWYARNMYIQGNPQYDYHVKTYGHPSKVGFKDLIPMFKAAKFDPEGLMDLYVKAGAKYFFSMGVHHDNFDMWDSKYQPRWNAVATGPKMDIVKMWRVAARKRGLRFGVSEHLSNSYDWLSTSHTSDKTGPLAGVPYDGTDPKFADLYHDYSDMPADFTKTATAMGKVSPTRWKQQYFNRIKDLVDQHEPDLLYTDGKIPFEEYGLATIAEMYNLSAKNHGGKVEAVYNSKVKQDCTPGTCALDRERAVLDDISADPWQTDTCIGVWHYKRGITYKTQKKVVDMLVDIVSKNGNLLLNIPLPNTGEPDAEELKILAGITEWMQINSEGIYASRPWKVYGEGPGTNVEKTVGINANENKHPDLGVKDIRYTTKGKTLYAFVMGWPEPGAEFVLPALGLTSAQAPGKIAHVAMLGTGEKLQWKQEGAALKVKAPNRKPSETAAAIGSSFKITLA